MNADQARMEFAPPPTPGLVRAMALAIVAHALLLAVLSVGVQWKRDPTPVTVEAELWSALPIEAAPKAPQPVPPPPPEPEKPTVVAKEVVTTPPTPVSAVPDPSIAIAKEKAKARQQKDKQREYEREKEQDRLELEKRQKDAVLKAKKLKDKNEAREAEQREKLARDKKLQLEQQNAQSARTDADAKKIAELRKQQIDRMNRMANQATGSGDANASGSAKQVSGPSAGYSGKIVERIKSNTNFSDSTAGRLSVQVLVRITPTGSILSSRVLTSSGNKVWDDAVLRSIEKMGTVPPDVDGRIPETILKEGMLLTVTL